MSKCHWIRSLYAAVKGRANTGLTVEEWGLKAGPRACLQTSVMGLFYQSWWDYSTKVTVVKSPKPACWLHTVTISPALPRLLMSAKRSRQNADGFLENGWKIGCESRTSWLISLCPEVGRWSEVQQKEMPLHICFFNEVLIGHWVNRTKKHRGCGLRFWLM